MKNLTLVTLKKVNEVNTSLENRWRYNHDDDSVGNAKFELFLTRFFLIVALVCVGVELWQKYPISPTNEYFTSLASVFFVTSIFCLVGFLRKNKFGTRLEELCKIFGCNFGQLAVMDFKVIIHTAEDILDDLVYDLVCKEKKYKLKHPIEAVARMEYERVLEVFVDLEIRNGRVDDIFARANEKFALEHQQQVATPV